MSLKNLFTLESMLNTHDSPIVIIDENLIIVGVNDAGENYYKQTGSKRLGNHCCNNKPNCRHQAFFETPKAYAGYYSDNVPTEHENKHKKCWFTGFPITSTDNKVFLGEILTPDSCQYVLPQPHRINFSPEYLKLQIKLQQMAKTTVPILLSGETGTGKEVAAKFIHQQSSQAEADLVIVDCTLLTESLFESELFGHEKGAFTNAMSAKKGLFELADKSTLFLDEIGELPLSQQPKLLRALESGQFRRVGGTQTLTSNVRIISATHRNLEKMVKEGLFREDLFYRLSVLSVDILPLRERKQDIPMLVDTFLMQEACEHSVSQQAFSKLIQHNWPGNIRELKNCIQLAVALTNDGSIDAQHIHILRRRSIGLEQQEVRFQNTFVPPAIPPVKSERELIQHLLIKFKGNRKRIANEIGVTERTLYRKLSKHQLG